MAYSCSLFGSSPRRAALLSLLAVACVSLASCGGGTSSSSSGTVASIAVTPASPSIAMNATQQFTATAKDSSGNTISGVAFTWASSATTMATINSSGLATGVGVGTTQITAAASGVTSPPDTLTLTAPVVASITVSPASPSIAVTTTQQFTATAKDGSGNTISGVLFTWASSATGKATITNSGLATGVATGTTQITAAASGITSPADTLTVTPAPTSVTGTASLGAPIVGGLVTLKDSLGASSTATTGATGGYTVSTTGFTPPFFVRVVTTAGSISFPAGTTLYSVSADAHSTTIINTHLLTDLIVRTWYSTQSVNPDTAFANPVVNPAPSPLAVQTIAGPIIQMAQLWFNNAGVNVVATTPAVSPQFNMISSAYTANNTGFDSVLHLTSETLNGGNGQVTQIQITNGTTTQISQITYAPTTFTLNSTTTSAAYTSTNSVTGVAPTTAQQAALNAITTTLNNFSATINAKGNALASGDILPFLASDYLDGGLNQSLQAAQYASSLAGTNFTQLQVVNVRSIDLTNGLADTVVALGYTQNAVAQTGALELFLELSSGSWLLRGDQRIVDFSGDRPNLNLVTTRTTEGACGGPCGTSTSVAASFSAPEIPTATPTVTAAAITGGTNATPPALGNNIFNAAAFTQGNTEIDAGVSFDDWNGPSAILASALAAATPFRVDVTCTAAAAWPACKPSGSVVSYTLPSNGFTNEGISITSPNSGALSSVVGQTFTVTWTLPASFAIAQIRLNAAIYDGAAGASNFCTVPGVTTTVITTTSASITIPANMTCESNVTIASMDLVVQVTGVNGEFTQADVRF